MLDGRVIGDGPPILFVHGLGAARSYWGSAFDALADRHRLGFVDLAGFGASMHADGPYDVSGHLASLAAFRAENLGAERLLIVGHSFGGILAAAAGAKWPAVSRCVLFNLPAFRSEQEARDRISALGVMERWMAQESWRARAMCWFMCHARPVARSFAPSLVPNLPPAIVRDGVQHMWPAYKASFDALVKETDLRAWIPQHPRPPLIVQGTSDPICPPDVAAAALADINVELTERPGDHHLPVRDPIGCLELIRQEARA